MERATAKSSDGGGDLWTEHDLEDFVVGFYTKIARMIVRVVGFERDELNSSADLPSDLVEVIFADSAFAGGRITDREWTAVFKVFDYLKDMRIRSSDALASTLARNVERRCRERLGSGVGNRRKSLEQLTKEARKRRIYRAELR